MRQQIRRAMYDHDRLVVVFDYTDKQGNRTRRVASPIRFAASGGVLALCLCREEPRLFYMDQISNLRLASAHRFLMPVPISAAPAAMEVA